MACELANGFFTYITRISGVKIILLEECFQLNDWLAEVFFFRKAVKPQL